MNLNPIDLQIQTTASDGKHTPAECVAMAKENGVHTIAITDHDTVAGVEEAAGAGRKLGVRVIPGIEISAEDHDIHLLGLGIDAAHPPLTEALGRFAEERRRGAEEMVGRFAADGFVVPWEEVLGAANGAVITRPHIVDVILAHPENRAKLGGVSSRHDFFRQFFTNDSKYYVRRSNLSARDAIGLIHGAGGAAVWSHPPVPDFWENCPGLAAFLEELVAAELDGLELFGPFLTERGAACLEELVRRHGLFATAGSDFHERAEPTISPWPRSAVAIGEYPTYGRELDGMLEALERCMAKRRRIASGAGNGI